METRVSSFNGTSAYKKPLTLNFVERIHNVVHKNVAVYTCPLIKKLLCCICIHSCQHDLKCVQTQLGKNGKH